MVVTSHEMSQGLIMGKTSEPTEGIFQMSKEANHLVPLCRPAPFAIELPIDILAIIAGHLAAQEGEKIPWKAVVGFASASRQLRSLLFSIWFRKLEIRRPYDWETLKPMIGTILTHIKELRFHANANNFSAVSSLPWNNSRLSTVDVLVCSETSPDPFTVYPELLESIRHLRITARTHIYNPSVPLWFLTCVPTSLLNVESVQLIVDNKCPFSFFAEKGTIPLIAGHIAVWASKLPQLRHLTIDMSLTDKAIRRDTYRICTSTCAVSGGCEGCISRFGLSTTENELHATRLIAERVPRLDSVQWRSWFTPNFAGRSVCRIVRDGGGLYVSRDRVEVK